MTVRKLGRALGLSPSLVSRLIRRGMPADSEAAARSWRLQFVQARRRDEGVGKIPHTTPEANIVDFDSVPGGLEASLVRLRELECQAAATLRKLLREGRIGEAASMRSQHASILRSLFDAESKAMRLAQERGELITMDTATKMVIAALSETTIMLRQLPSLGRDEAEKQKLTAFMNGVLTAMRDGMASVMHNGAARAVAQGGAIP